MIEPSPLGITPRFIMAENRFADIDDAIKRFVEAYQPIPVEWIEERNEIIDYLNKRNTKYLDGRREDEG